MDNPSRDLLVNCKSLTTAIMKAVGMSPEEYAAAESMADHLLGFFGYQDRVIDNLLEPMDRNLFYQFQDWGLLDTEGEETTLWDGREWRIHYWKIRTERVVDTNFFDKEVVDTEVVDIYKNLSDSDWRIKTYDDNDSWLPKKQKSDEY
jgi:hypothetical protein